MTELARFSRLPFRPPAVLRDISCGTDTGLMPAPRKIMKTKLHPFSTIAFKYRRGAYAGCERLPDRLAATLPVRARPVSIRIHVPGSGMGGFPTAAYFQCDVKIKCLAACYASLLQIEAWRCCITDENSEGGRFIGGRCKVISEIYVNIVRGSSVSITMAGRKCRGGKMNSSLPIPVAACIQTKNSHGTGQS